MPRRVQRQIERHPMVAVWSMLFLMAASVLGLIGWKAESGREAAIGRAEQDVKNLVHSLAQHAVHTIRAPDVVMAGVAEMLAYRKPDSADRLNSYLASTVRTLPQLREIKVLDAGGRAIYSSALPISGHNNADREYFRYHESHADPELLISGPFSSRTTGMPTLVLSRRITNAATGEFVGVVMASILTDYFGDFYRTFGIGEHGGVSLITGEGRALVHLPSGTSGKDLSQTDLFKVKLHHGPSGFYAITSPYDGLSKYFGYEQAEEYGLVVAVARTYDEIVSSWRADLKIDAAVAVGLLLAILAISFVLARQFIYRARLEQSLRERERRHRLLADNIADVVVVLDSRGICQYVSQSVSAALGVSEEQVLGRPYIDFVHPDDRKSLARVGHGWRDDDSAASVSFRMMHADGSTAWFEANFRSMDAKRRNSETVAVLRDITQRKVLEEQLSSANRRLSQLATTDGLTQLANRRGFDAYLRETFQRQASMAVLLIDIDHFKGFNDALGHQAGDECLRRIAGAIATAAGPLGGHASRYGGEEFAIILRGVTESRALALADALRGMVSALEIPHPAVGGSVTVSIGVAEKSDNACDEAALVREADIALYQAKRLGRDRTVAASSLKVGSSSCGTTLSIVPNHDSGLGFELAVAG